MLAVETGADAVGLIFAASPKQVTQAAAGEIARHLPPFITPVGVFVNPTYDELAAAKAIFPDLVYQLHGDESPPFVSSIDGKLIKAIHVDAGSADTAEIESRAEQHPRAIILFDTKVQGMRGGTGVAFSWRAVAPIARRRPVMMSGGLTAENVSNCVRTVRPYGVDVRSGIETDGRKDPLKMRMFVQAVKDTDAS